ncbi:Tautomerase/MIF [Lenzites betulinus]|nr:Tautomerase/MIF [Lenzites betulinus]
MPTVELKTNVRVADPKAFSLEFSKFSAETLGKPEAYISVNYIYNEFLTFNGTFDPAIVLVINSLDNISPALNEGYSKAFFAFIKEKLGVEDTRGYICFIDPGRANIAYNSTTFETIFGGPSK